VLEGPDGVLIEQSLRFAFKVRNNQAKYEALLAGMKLATSNESSFRGDSNKRSTIDQISGKGT
jgi:hypothetical protein